MFVIILKRFINSYIQITITYIFLIKYNNLFNELHGVNIWSIDIGYDDYNNEILWILSDMGAQGYILYQSYSTSGNLTVDYQQINQDF